MLLANAVAQLPHSYQCDFEDEAENALWTLNKPKNEGYTWLNQWYIGGATASLGKQSMYISPDGGANVGYLKEQSRIMIAWRELTMEAGRYDLAFDWMCGGDSVHATLLVAWVPESQFGDMTCALSDDYNARKWIQQNILMFNRGGLLTGGSVWTHAVDTLVSDGTPHRLVFLFVYGSSAQLVQPGPCVDNIQLCRNNCGVPTQMHSSVMSKTVTMNWQSSAEAFGLRLHRMGDNVATEVSNILQTEYSTSLQEGVYDIQIRTICSGDTSVWYNFPTTFVYETKCFDYLDLTDERCSFSLTTPNDYHGIDTMNLLQKGKIDYGFTSSMSRHTIHFHPEEYDARTYGSIDSENNFVMPLKTVPDGALASVRVGSWEKTARVARVEYDFTVDAKEAAVLMLQYAMVLESSGHSDDIQRPRMTIDIVDYNTGAPLSTCTTVNLASQTSGEGWYRVPDPTYTDGSRDVCWRDWTTLGLNLADFDGRHVKVKITAYGCNATIHYGYAYFTLTCTSGQLQGIQCGWTPTNEFIAPEGFNYRWYLIDAPTKTLSTNRIYPVDYKDTRDYAVDVTYKSNPSCGFTLYANAIPRFPIPEATYTIEQRDCGNWITFHNTSHIRTHNWATGEDLDTSLPPEYLLWDLDGFVPTEYAEGHTSWNPSFRLPDGEADYHFSLIAGVGLCDSVRKLDIHVPRVGKDSVVERVERCEGDIYEHYGKYYLTDTVIIDEDYNRAGCDSVHTIQLRFVTAIRDTVRATIPEGETYTMGDQTFSDPGEYQVKLLSVAGCDSIVTLYLEVVVPLEMELTEVENPCPEDTSLLINIRARKGKPDTYSLLFDPASGFPQQSGSLSGSGEYEIVVPKPSAVRPGFYGFLLAFDSELSGRDTVAGEVMVHYSASLIRQRWDDVLGILNADYNGGYTFGGYQWLLNGQTIDGATQPYLYVPGKLQPGDEYAVLLYPDPVVNERGIPTCSYIVPVSSSPSPAQAPQKILENGQMVIQIGGRTYNAQGKRIY